MHIMKYLCVSNKVGTPCALFLHKIQTLAFSGLGEHLNGSLATKNPIFWQLENWTQDYLNHRELIDSISNKNFEDKISVA